MQQLRDYKNLWDFLEIVLLMGFLTFLLWKHASHFDETEIDSLVYFAVGMLASKLGGRVTWKK